MPLSYAYNAFSKAVLKTQFSDSQVLSQALFDAFLCAVCGDFLFAFCMAGDMGTTMSIMQYRFTLKWTPKRKYPVINNVDAWQQLEQYYYVSYC